MVARRSGPQAIPIWSQMAAMALKALSLVWASLIIPAMPLGMIFFTWIFLEGQVRWFHIAVRAFCVVWYPVYRLLQWLGRSREQDLGPSDAEWSQPFE